MGKSSPDTSGQERAAREANELQERIYNESVERGEPWYEAGTQGLGVLLDYLGLEGGKSTQSRESIYDELSPQYTTEQSSPASGFGSEPVYIDKTGALTTEMHSGMYNGLGRNKLFQPQVEPQSVIDTAGLNAAVDERYAAQESAEKPDHFGSLLTPFSQDQFEVDAGFNFRQEEGQKGIERQLAAQGKTFSPEAAKELTRFNQGLASQEYGNAYNRYNVDQGNIYNRLAGIAGMGQQQIQQLDQAGQTFAGNVSQTNASLADAQSAAQQSGGSMFDNLIALGGLGVQAFAASDRALKENIIHIGYENGHRVYEYNYIGDGEKYIGVMAQDVLPLNPEAVVVINGSYAVDYDRIGVNFRKAA